MSFFGIPTSYLGGMLGVGQRRGQTPPFIAPGVMDAGGLAGSSAGVGAQSASPADDEYRLPEKMARTAAPDFSGQYQDWEASEPKAVAAKPLSFGRKLLDAGIAGMAGYADPREGVAVAQNFRQEPQEEADRENAQARQAWLDRGAQIEKGQQIARNEQDAQRAENDAAWDKTQRDWAAQDRAAQQQQRRDAEQQATADQALANDVGRYRTGRVEYGTEAPVDYTRMADGSPNPVTRAFVNAQGYEVLVHKDGRQEVTQQVQQKTKAARGPAGGGRAGGGPALKDRAAALNTLSQETQTKLANLDKAHRAGDVDDAGYVEQAVAVWRNYAQSVRRYGQVPTATPDLGALYLKAFGNPQAAEDAMTHDGWEIPRG